MLSVCLCGWGGLVCFTPAVSFSHWMNLNGPGRGIGHTGKSLEQLSCSQGDPWQRERASVTFFYSQFVLWLPVRCISGKHGFGERGKAYSEFHGNSGGSLSICNYTDYFQCVGTSLWDFRILLMLGLWLPLWHILRPVFRHYFQYLEWICQSVENLFSWRICFSSLYTAWVWTGTLQNTLALIQQNS